MFKNTFFFWLLLTLYVGCQSNAQTNTQNQNGNASALDLTVGSEQFELYIDRLRHKKIGIVANQSSLVKNKNKTYTHLVDTLLTQGINIVKVFSPEHGFRGTVDAGTNVNSSVDNTTKLPIISLYGSNKKPKASQLKGLDLVMFDLQDVGVRFYTYISTLHYVMEACAQNRIPLIVFDRPNPNCHYVDGPVLEPQFHSFVGIHPVPVVYGMSIGEYATMINGEQWLAGGIRCNLTVIPLKHYTRATKYNLPTKPSPNLPNAKAINLYPSLCFFEGTTISCGRGTDTPFEIFGSPKLPNAIYPFNFTPEPKQGAKNPKHNYEQCHGLDLSTNNYLDKINLNWLLEAYKNHPDKKNFFTYYFNTLAGTNKLKEQIKLGYSEDDIRKTWQPKLDKFKKIREKYLLYH